MKRDFLRSILFGLVASHAIFSVRAQGTIIFDTLVPAAGLDAPVFVWSLGGSPPGPTYSAGLYKDGLLIPGSLTRFRDGSDNPSLSKYIDPVLVTIPGTEPGQLNIAVEMRAWLTSAGSFEAAPLGHRGTSGALVISTLGGSSDPSHLPASFTGFVIPAVPEPSTIALAIFGAALLGGWRHRSRRS